MLADLPAGSRVFVDANIIVYLHVLVDPLTEETIRFFERVENRELEAVTSTHVLGEAAHRIMVAQAAEQLGITQRDALNKLRHAHDLVRSLRLPVVIEQTLLMPLEVEPVVMTDILQAERAVRSTGMLMNDSVTLAVMNRLQLTDLVSNDDDFLDQTSLRVWQPRRA